MLQGDSAPRDLVGLVMPDVPAQFDGISADLTFYGLFSRWDSSRFLELRYQHATGTLPGGAAVADGAPVDVRMRSMDLFEVECPLIIMWNALQGVDADARFRLSGVFGIGLAYAWGTASVTTPRGTSDQDMHRADLLLRPELDACLRVAGPAWACAAASTNMHEFGWFNGGALGLRLEARL
jgi:hypothetical protein